MATELSNSFASLRRVFELIDEKEVVDESALEAIDIPKGVVQFQDVSFRYIEDKPLIENLNIDIPAGSKVAIVGPTGCGKTTLINLLMRFYDIHKGKIIIDGENIKFSVIGYGHGVGMSQTGADALAKQGKNYEEIIKHFYVGVEIIDM